MQLTDFDKELLSMTSVPEEVLQIIKDSFGLPIYQYFGYSDEELDYVPFDGVCVNLGKMQYPGHEIRAFVEELNRHFTERALPFTAFGSEYFIELEDGDDCVAVIPEQMLWPLYGQQGPQALTPGSAMRILSIPF